jgi:hypothetical protein
MCEQCNRMHQCWWFPTERQRALRCNGCCALGLVLLACAVAGWVLAGLNALVLPCAPTPDFVVFQAECLYLAHNGTGFWVAPNPAYAKAHSTVVLGLGLGLAAFVVSLLACWCAVPPAPY